MVRITPPAVDFSSSDWQGPGWLTPKSIDPLKASTPGTPVMLPVHFEPRYQYPLIVWFPQPGSDGRELYQVMPLISDRNYIATAVSSRSTEVGQPGNVSDGTLSVEAAVLAAEAAAERYSVHPGRVYAVGVGATGEHAIEVALARPDVFAGAAALASRFPKSASLAQWSKLRKQQFLITTGADGDAYPVNDVQDDIRLWHLAGLTVELRYYPGSTELTDRMLADLDRWLIDSLHHNRVWD